MQVGFNAERRLTTLLPGDDNAFRGVLFARYIFMRGDSMYLPPAHFIEAFTEYQQNFLPFPQGDRPRRRALRRGNDGRASLPARLPDAVLGPGNRLQGWTSLFETGMAGLQRVHDFNELSTQFSAVHYLPDLTPALDGCPQLQAAARPALEWLAETRLAGRIYGATGLPTRGEFFTMGGDDLFRGFDQSQREGSTVWVGSLEWRVPLVKGLTYDAFDHVMGLRSIYGAAFLRRGRRLFERAIPSARRRTRSAAVCGWT